MHHHFIACQAGWYVAAMLFFGAAVTSHKTPTWLRLVDLVATVAAVVNGLSIAGVL